MGPCKPELKGIFSLPRSSPNVHFHQNFGKPSIRSKKYHLHRFMCFQVHAGGGIFSQLVHCAAPLCRAARVRDSATLSTWACTLRRGSSKSHSSFSFHFKAPYFGKSKSERHPEETCRKKRSWEVQGFSDLIYSC